MSVHYKIKEHFIMENNDTCGARDAREVVADQLLEVAGYMLCGRVDHCTYRLTADGQDYHFQGDGPDHSLKLLTEALLHAECVEFCADYDYISYGSLGDHTPFRMCAYMQELGERAPEGLFYSAYHQTDCGDGLGSLVAYGRMDGRLYTGAVPRRAVDALPEDGEWERLWDGVSVCEAEDLPPEILPRCEAICRELCTMSRKDTLAVDDTGIDCYLNNLKLRGRADLETYIRLCREMENLLTSASRDPVEDGCVPAWEFEDFSGSDVRFLHLTPRPDGTCGVELTEV